MDNSPEYIRSHFNVPVRYVKIIKKRTGLLKLQWCNENRLPIGVYTLGKKIDGILCYYHPITQQWHSVATGGVVHAR